MTSIFIRDGWWRTVTPGELRESTVVVEAFLNGTGSAPPHAVEALARALALSQLFSDRGAVVASACKAEALMPAVERVRDAHDAASSLARGQAFLAGFNRCLELLKPQHEAVWQVAVDRFQLKLHLVEPALARASESEAAHAAVRNEEARRRDPKPNKPFKA